MEKIKVMVASRPRLMRDVLLEVISSQPDIELVAEVQDESRIMDLVGELSPDWLFIALDQPERRPDICDPLLTRFPNVKVLALASQKNNCIFYWANVSIRSSRVESSEKGILDVLRSRRPVSAAAFDLPTSKKVN